MYLWGSCPECQCYSFFLQTCTDDCVRAGSSVRFSVEGGYASLCPGWAFECQAGDVGVGDRFLKGASCAVSTTLLSQILRATPSSRGFWLPAVRCLPLWQGDCCSLRNPVSQVSEDVSRSPK